MSGIYEGLFFFRTKGLKQLIDDLANVWLFSGKNYVF